MKKRKFLASAAVATLLASGLIPSEKALAEQTSENMEARQAETVDQETPVSTERDFFSAYHIDLVLYDGAAGRYYPTSEFETVDVDVYHFADNLGTYTLTRDEDGHYRRTLYNLIPRSETPRGDNTIVVPGFPNMYTSGAFAQEQPNGDWELTIEFHGYHFKNRQQPLTPIEDIAQPIKKTQPLTPIEDIAQPIKKTQPLTPIEDIAKPIKKTQPLAPIEDIAKPIKKTQPLTPLEDIAKPIKKTQPLTPLEDIAKPIKKTQPLTPIEDIAQTVKEALTLTHEETGITVTIQAEDVVPGLRLDVKRVTPEQNQELGLTSGQALDLFDLNVLDENGQKVRFKHPVAVTIPLEAYQDRFVGLKYYGDNFEVNKDLAHTVDDEKIHFSTDSFSYVGVVYKAESKPKAPAPKAPAQAPKADEVKKESKTLPKTGITPELSLVTGLVFTSLGAGLKLRRRKK